MLTKWPESAIFESVVDLSITEVRIIDIVRNNGGKNFEQMWALCWFSELFRAFRPLLPWASL